jgi:hypothetical protein
MQARNGARQRAFFQRGGRPQEVYDGKSSNPEEGSERVQREISRAARGKAKRGGRRWSKRVTETSDAMDLEGGVFKLRDPKKIAASLKRSAERSHRRKANPYRSALSMLTFYINRAGRNLPASRKKALNRAKDELKHQFHRD